MKISLLHPSNLGKLQMQKEINSLSELCDIITKARWAPASFAGESRLAKDFVSIDLLVLDIDEGCSLEEAKEIFKEYKHVIATSRNHQKEKHGVVRDRFRVVLFLGERIDNERDYKATWDTAHASWPFIDKACKDVARFFYPSPEVVSVNESGSLYEVSQAPPEDALDKALSRGPGSEAGYVEKGELWKSTLKFLLEGAPAGHRHHALVQAVGNMREQGYSKDEVVSMITDMTARDSADWTQVGLNQHDIKTIDRMFAREMKYGYTPRAEAETEKNQSVIVTAAELLSETFEYLADKDKVKGEPTGIDGLDKLLGGGFRTGELTVLMAQAKTGKNTLYHYLIYKYLERGIPFGYASRELNPATEVVPNLLSIALKANTWNADLSDDFKERARAAMRSWQLYFAPGYGYFKPDDIETWFRTLKDMGVDHFLFDHFHYALLKEDHESTADLIKRLKSLTKSLDIHLSLIVQPRSLREGETLSLATLRGGSAIGQALDNLLILERVKGETNISRLTLEVARHKLAKLGDINLMYNTDTTEFIEVDKRTVVVENPVPQGVRSGPKFHRLT